MGPLFAFTVCFHEIPYEDLSEIVEFMYTGCIDVEPSRLPAILAACDKLRFIPLMKQSLVQPTNGDGPRFVVLSSTSNYEIHAKRIVNAEPSPQQCTRPKIIEIITDVNNNNVATSGTDQHSQTVQSQTPLPNVSVASEKCEQQK